jgi:hypothetical protein
MFMASEDFPRQAKLVSVHGSVSPGVGERLEVFQKGKWWRAKVIGVEGEQRKVRYAGYDDSWDEWVSPDRVRSYQAAQFGDGDKVEVYWPGDKTWYPATVLRGWYGLHLIRYDGYDPSMDEWVSPSKIRRRQ